MNDNSRRVVITGIGLTSPNGNSLAEYRKNLLSKVSGVKPYNIRYIGDTFAGLCDFDQLKYQQNTMKKIITIGLSILLSLMFSEGFAKSAKAKARVPKARIAKAVISKTPSVRLDSEFSHQLLDPTQQISRKQRLPAGRSSAEQLPKTTYWVLMPHRSAVSPGQDKRPARWQRRP